MPGFDQDATGDYLASPEWGAILGEWEGYVRAVVERKDMAPSKY